MYLAVAVIEAEPEPGDVDRLRHAIRATSAPSDRVEHICVDRQDHRAVVALYLLGADSETANRVADQLCRRAAVAWRGLRPWLLRSCAVRTIGSVGHVET